MKKNIVLSITKNDKDLLLNSSSFTSSVISMSLVKKRLEDSRLSDDLNLIYNIFMV